MENWREKYYKNFSKGLLLSIVIHFALLSMLIFLPMFTGELPDYYSDYKTFNVNLTRLSAYPNEAEGGGSSNKGPLDNGEEGKNFSDNTIIGTPIPLPEPIEDNFGNGNDITDKKDSTQNSLGGGTGSGSGSGIGKGSGGGSGDGIGGGHGYATLPFMPRQILEVLPQNTDDAEGIIVLVLMIGIDGRVKEHKIVYNTTNNSVCLKNTIDAAYKSKWEPVKIEGKQIQYWIEKTYRFN